MSQTSPALILFLKVSVRVIVMFTVRESANSKPGA